MYTGPASLTDDRTMTSLQNQQGPIDEAIVNGLIAATPEWWSAAKLEVEWRPRDGGVEGYAHTITSPEGHRDLVEATDEICAETLRLAELFRRCGKQWTRVVYSVKQQPDGQWSYTADFTY